MRLTRWWDTLVSWFLGRCNRKLALLLMVRFVERDAVVAGHCGAALLLTMAPFAVQGQQLCDGIEPDVATASMATFPSNECDGTAASATCAHTCVAGFQGGSVTCSEDTGAWSIEPCTDINECDAPCAPPCGANAACTNVLGSYQCDCDSGWASRAGGQGFTRVTSGAVVERADISKGAVAFDADGDGDQDAMVFNDGQTNELLISDGVGGFTRVTSGVAVERSDRSFGGAVFDATGDGTADDVMVFNHGQASELLVGDGVGGFTRVTNSPAVERADNSLGIVVIDASGDGSANDVMVFNQPSCTYTDAGEVCVGGENELLLNDGAGGFARVASGVAVERSDWSLGGIVFDATGDGTADDVMVFNVDTWDSGLGEYVGNNEVLLNDGTGGFTRGELVSEPSAKDLLAFRNGQTNHLFVLRDGSDVDAAATYTLAETITGPAAGQYIDFALARGIAFDANGDDALDLMIFAIEANELLLGDGAGFTRVTSGAAVERTDYSTGGILFDVNGDDLGDLMIFTNGPNELLVGVLCADVDECAIGTDSCDANAACTNTAGSFACACNGGYGGDGEICTDVDECTDGLDNCGDAQCVNTEGGFDCACGSGFAWDGTTCIDVDECACTEAQATLACDGANNNGYYPGGYPVSDCPWMLEHYATCDGLVSGKEEGIPVCGGYCDACGSRRSICGHNCDATNAACANVPGSFSCACNDGWSGDGVTCTDIDECMADTDTCGGLTCINTPGSFDCACETGYSWGGTSCEDVDECTCTAAQAALACSGPNGNGADDPALDGLSCAQLEEWGDTCDELVVGEGFYPSPVCGGYCDACGSRRSICGHNCDATNAACTNVPGSFSCACNDGWSGDGVTCTDIDECMAGTHNCDDNAACVNTPGSFLCACNAGWCGNGASCSDFDECTAGTDNCDASAICTNTPGAFSCICDAGYSGDGNSCVDDDECVLGTDNCGGLTCINTAGSFTCACDDGYSWDSTSQACADVDECASGLDNNCSASGAMCSNAIGSYTCSCEAGWIGDGTHCTDDSYFSIADTSELPPYQGFTRVTTGAAVERTAESYEGIAFDADGDGIEDDVMIYTQYSPWLPVSNELLLGHGSGGFTRAIFVPEPSGKALLVFTNSEANVFVLRDGEGLAATYMLTDTVTGPAYLLTGEYLDFEPGGIAFDANGDGATDLMIFTALLPNELLLGDGAGGFTRVTSGAAVERADTSIRGIAFDATGDGTADDVMVFNDGQNELLINDGAGEFTRVTSGAAVERADWSEAGVAFDANGDGLSDLMIFNSFGATNELLLNDGAGGFARVTSGPAVELADASMGGVAFDADSDGLANDVMVFNFRQPNELLLNDGTGVFTRVTSGPAVERTDDSLGGVAFDATGDGTVDDLMVFNSPELDLSAYTEAILGGAGFDSLPEFIVPGTGANELLLGGGFGFSHAPSGAAVERADVSNGAIAFDADGDGLENDVLVFNWGQANELLLSDGFGGFTRVSGGAAVERMDCSDGGLALDATGDGTADDVMVFNTPAEVWDADAGLFVMRDGGNELLINVGAVSFERATLVSDSGKSMKVFTNGQTKTHLFVRVSRCGTGVLHTLVETITGPVAGEYIDFEPGGIAFDANGDGVDDLMVFKGGHPNDHKGESSLGEANELLLGTRAGGFTRVTSGTAVERADASQAGIAFDADADGDLDVMVFNSRMRTTPPQGQNELLINDGLGGFTRVTKGAAVERSDTSYGGIVLDATGDGTADDVMVFNSEEFQFTSMFGRANELLINSGNGDFTRVMGGAAVELTGSSHGGILFDADGDGSMDHVMILNRGQQGAAIGFVGAPNELLRFGPCNSPDLATQLLGLGQLEGSTTCYTCPPFSTGSLRPKLCKYCPSGRVGPSDTNGEAIRGWRVDQPYACGMCAAGRFRAETQQTESCTDCLVGRYAGAGFGECQQCDTGRVTSLDGLSPSGPVGAATSCVSCAPGQGPNAARTGCETCDGNRYSSFGVCLDCPANELVSDDKTRCSPCPRGETPVGGRCQCEPGRYNSSFGLIFCFDGEYHSDRLQSDDMQVTRVELEQRQICLPCPGDCLRCDGNGEPEVRPGYSLSPAGMEIWNSSLWVDGLHMMDRSLFWCPADGLACSNCLNGTICGESRRMLAGSGALVRCAPGHGGALCGSCSDGWTGSFNSLCTPCPTTEGEAATMTFLIVAAFGAALVLYRCCTKTEAAMRTRLSRVRKRYAVVRKAVKVVQLQGAASEVAAAYDGSTFQSLKETIVILIANLQIISQFPATLKFSCAACNHLTWLFRMLPTLNLDVLSAVSFDCIAEVNLYTRFFFVVLLPVVVVLILQVRARLLCNMAVRVQPAEGRTVPARIRNANQSIFIVLFLTYPTVTSTVFTMFACRELDMRQSYHVYDAQIDCTGGTYKLMRVIAFTTMLLLPVGIPAAFGALLYKNRTALRAAGADNDEAVPFDAFKKTIQMTEPDSTFSDSALEALYKTIGADGPGGAARTLVQHVLNEADLVDGHDDSSECEQVRPADVSSDGGLAVEPHKWWRGGPEDFAFLVRAFEPEFYCEPTPNLLW
eukprot:COSAG04_NODE_90_length_26856_cov_18.273723_20_plen_2565_part_00